MKLKLSGPQVVIEEIPEMKIIRKMPVCTRVTIEKAITPERLKWVLRYLYEEELFSLREMERTLERGHGTIRGWLKYYGINIRPERRMWYYGELTDEPRPPERKMVAGRACEVHYFLKTHNLAWLTGYLLGDGTIQDDVATAYTASKELFHVLTKLMSEYGTATPEFLYLWIEDEKVMQKKVERQEQANFYLVRLYRAAFARLIKVVDGARWDVIEELGKDPEFGYALLAGFIDADGTIDPRGKRVSAFSTDKGLLRIIESITNRLGFTTTFRIKEERMEGIRNSFPFARVAETMYEFYIWKRDSEKFLEKAAKHFKHPYKIKSVKRGWPILAPTL